MRRRAGEKTSGEEETNGNNKPGDGGKSKHAEIAHTGNEIIEEPHGGGAYIHGGRVQGA